MSVPKMLFSTLLLSFFVAPLALGQVSNSPEGRWNLTISQEGEALPAWLEIEKSGTNALVGRFCYAFGSARPISEVNMLGDRFYFSIPPQWEPGAANMELEGTLEGEQLKGTMVYADGKTYEWTAQRTPKLPYTENPKWGKEIALFNGKDLEGWQAEGDNQWSVKDGILTNAKAGANLISEEKFNDFKIVLEFRYPEGSNSGLYLRGRYEVQIADNWGAEPHPNLFGGIYGLLAPNEMAAKKAGEWQTYEITLNGRRVTIVANGKTIIADQNILGMTGGALDNDEAAPGPIMLQGDHGAVEFRKIAIRPRIPE
ncbi:DUF1080 domain-containing protein [Maribacter sp. 2307ULW6-5]|uniref:3-keto-disaccharide hydrolase n=1 Tax=Maribacter sp. 2307ULW6-5 TaxID=3386275 RepID=UPI0039BD646B